MSNTTFYLPHHDVVSRLFESFGDGHVPQYHISEVDDAYEIDIAVPGYKKSDLSLSVEKGVLTVSGEPSEANRMFGSSKFAKRFRIPAHVDNGQIEAHYLDGVLSVRIPKSKSSIRTSVATSKTRRGRPSAPPHFR